MQTIDEWISQDHGVELRASSTIGTSKERGAVGVTDIGGLLHNQLLTGGRRHGNNSKELTSNQAVQAFRAVDPGRCVLRA